MPMYWLFWSSVCRLARPGIFTNKYCILFYLVNPSVYVSNNTHILIYWYAKCDCKLWNIILSEVLCFHPDYVSINTFWCANMPDVTEDYGRFSDWIAAFDNFHIILCSWNIITLSKFYENLCNHLWLRQSEFFILFQNFQGNNLENFKQLLIR